MGDQGAHGLMPRVLAADTGEPVHIPEKDTFSVTITFEAPCQCDFCRASPSGGVKCAPTITLSEWPQSLRDNPGRTARIALMLRSAADYMAECADIPQMDWPLPPYPAPQKAE